MSFLSFNSFETACAFFTRFGRARIVSAQQIAESVFWYPVVGLLLGLLSSCIVWFCLNFLDNHIAPWGIAWLYVLFNVWVTRAMHWDGLADLCDAAGSNVDKVRFWEIIKDSCLGTFGCLALIVFFSGMLIAVHANILLENYYILILAPLLGRAFCLFFTRVASPYTSPYAKNSLSGAVYPGVKFAHLLFWAFIIICSLLVLFELATLIIFLLACAALFAYLTKIAKANAGYNGDFLGAIIIIVELLAFGILR